jgi:hypothetical protein
MDATTIWLEKMRRQKFPKENPWGSTLFTLRSADPTLGCIARESLKAHASLEVTREQGPSSRYIKSEPASEIHAALQQKWRG